MNAEKLYNTKVLNSYFHKLNNLFVTSKKRNHEFSNLPIHEFKVFQNVF